ncbi:P27 family phage terminase small subunit [Senegalia massiliensis]|uniref:P27 family phage terminase small subunit n=1 Tax=Senegalia massiliensis TaxID=1720316 RepID=UPI00103258A2|nr:P27 family phage terminase small subunit [Senegalia massiliensis]
MAKHKKTQIREDLIDQLERKGIYGSHYIDLINDYISMWEIKNQLIEDISERGVSVRYQNGKAQWGYKKNDSISELNKTNAQMLKILNELGLKASEVEMADDEDDEEM